MACELIMYTEFQISENKSDELVIFAKAVSMKKIAHFFRRVEFWFVQKTFLGYKQNVKTYERMHMLGGGR